MFISAWGGIESVFYSITARSWRGGAASAHTYGMSNHFSMLSDSRAALAIQARFMFSAIRTISQSCGL